MLTTTYRRLTARTVAFLTGLFLGLALGLAVGAAIVGAADSHASVPPAQPTCWQLQGTLIQIACPPPPAEDDPAFDCVRDGNRVCGPDNAQRKPAGCYDDGGVLVAPWPCHVVVDPATGESDVYEGAH